MKKEKQAYHLFKKYLMIYFMVVNDIYHHF